MRRVYAVRSEDGFIKFGVARDVERRLRAIGTGNAHQLRLVGATKLMPLRQAFDIEWLLHRAVSSLHKRGEWFISCPKTLAIGRMLTELSPERLREVLSDHAAREVNLLHKVQKGVPISSCINFTH
jgi:hypothetical protein